MNPRDPESMTNVLSGVLRFGVLLSGAIMLVAVALFVARYSSQSASEFLTYIPGQIPHGQFTVGLSSLPAGLAELDPFSYVELGVIVLLATPVARVLLSVFLFAAEGDRTYVYITTAVLLLLLFSILVTPLIPIFNA
jgi:uncharacterized membrane protein